MLICPQCQFENPDHHRFCQECGTSLILRPCPTCGADASYQAEYCPSCGDRIGTLWLAIIEPLVREPVAPTSHELTADSTDTGIGIDTDTDTDVLTNSADGAAADVLTHPDDRGDRNEAIVAATATEREPRGDDPVCSVPNSVSLPPFPVGQYLDPQQRYQVLEWLPTPPQMLYHCARVLDCKPLQVSTLDTIAVSTPPAAEDDLDGESSSGELGQPAAANSPTIPAIAEPYLLLPSQLGQVLPALHDAWQTEDYAIALLEDRSDWPTFIDHWQDGTVAPLEMLHWLHEMVVLWTILAGWHCCQSLLEPQNLRLDEDQVLCLQQLYPDDPTAPPTLAHLGQVWQRLLAQSQATLPEPILELLHALDQGRITTPTALRSRIEALAQDIQQPQMDADITIADTPTDELPEWYGTTIAQTPPPADLAIAETTGPLDLPDFNDIPLTPDMQAILQAQLDQDAQANDLIEDEEEAATVALPMRLASIQDAGRTDVGCKRQRNEDYFSILAECQKLETPLGRSVSARGVYILCDGMGGHAGGEVASTLAADTLRQFFLDAWFNAEAEPLRQDLPSRELIIQGINLANQAIYEINQQNASAGSGRMGTTLVLLLLQDSKVAIAHVGDSRLYRITRKQLLEQLTIDHEVGQQEIQRGVDPDIAYAHADAYQLTQALGPRNTDFMHPDIKFLDLHEDTLFLLCSDGLSDNNVVEEHWQTHLLPLLSSRANLDEGAQKLIDLANQYNGHDNITVLLVRVKLQPHLDYLQQLGPLNES
ncbi:serine/threonine phosphatase [Trichothermofontia sichuanensis B231]|uniref:serine/threonine phosphatase n=1 Tax=Trichothermofontia sichuanensis TaxID=3045816 RepID=UPI0022472EBF|nr:serine/threonine phosphatase [Trichothermofontia sichuanensis]UZQ54010.1 serine/threonine phosphatase [Trichothermofontia sichuanensis B231]